MKGYKKLTKDFNLKVTNKVSKQIFSLPMYPELSDKKIDKIIKVLKNF
jgi:dTDP-4-amino-4,6-dideoxygalactose transaminase